MTDHGEIETFMAQSFSPISLAIMGTDVITGPTWLVQPSGTYGGSLGQRRS